MGIAFDKVSGNDLLYSFTGVNTSSSIGGLSTFTQIKYMHYNSYNQWVTEYSSLTIPRAELSPDYDVITADGVYLWDNPGEHHDNFANADSATPFSGPFKNGLYVSGQNYVDLTIPGENFTIPAYTPVTGAIREYTFTGLSINYGVYTIVYDLQVEVSREDSWGNGSSYDKIHVTSVTVYYQDGAVSYPVPGFSGLAFVVANGYTGTVAKTFTDGSWAQFVAEDSGVNTWWKKTFIFPRKVTITFTYTAGLITAVDFSYTTTDLLASMPGYQLLYEFKAPQLSGFSCSAVTGHASGGNWVVGGSTHSMSTKRAALADSNYENKTFSGSNIFPMFISRLQAFQSPAIAVDSSNLPSDIYNVISPALSISGFDLDFVIKDGFVDSIVKSNNINYICSLESN